MYKHLSYYKLNIRSKYQKPTVKSKDTAFLTYSVGARFKYQTGHLCRDLFYSLQVNAPKINGLEIPQSIFFKTSPSSKNTFISQYHLTLNTVCSWCSVVKIFHFSTYPPSYKHIYKSYFILIISLSTKFQMPSFSGLLLIEDIYNQDNLHSPHISILRFARTLFYLNSASNSVKDPVLNLWDMRS